MGANRSTGIRTRWAAVAVGAASLLGVVLAGSADATVPSGTPSWTKQFGTNTDDRFYAVATNASGQVSATGTTTGSLHGTNLGQTDGILVRYDLNGRRKWARQFGTPEYDYSMAVATTRSGDTYVTGYTYGGFGAANAGPLGTEDVFLAKFDRTGNRKWVRQFGTVGDDEGLGVAVTSSGDVYIAGTTMGDITPGDFFDPLGGKDLFLAKYDRNGVRQWIHQGGSADHDNVGGLAVSTLMNTAYVAGDTSGTMPGAAREGDYDGYLTWFNLTTGMDVRYRQFGTPMGEAVHGVAVNSAGAAYVVGDTTGDLAGTSAGARDAFVVKYDATGTLRSTNQFGTSAFDSIQSVAIGPNDLLYVTGSTNGSLGSPVAGEGDIFTAQLDISGNRRWLHQFGSPATDWSYGISVTPVGDVLVAANTNGNLVGTNLGTDFDLVLAKFGKNSNKSWGSQFGSASLDRASSISAASNGRVFVAGSTLGDFADFSAGLNDAYYRVYSTDGAVLLESQFGTAAGDEAVAIGAAGNGDFYVIGTTDGTLGSQAYGATDGFIRKSSADGTVLWTRQFGTDGNDQVAAAVVARNGDVYVAGSTTSAFEGANLGSTDAFLGRFDKDGNIVWFRQFGTATDDALSGIALTPNGDAYVVGTTGGVLGAANLGGNDAIAARYTKSGTRKWLRQFGTAAADSSYSASVTSGGDLYISGFTEGAYSGQTQVGTADGTLVKLNRNGTLKWARQFGAPGVGTEALGVAVTRSGKVSVVGYTDGDLAGAIGGADTYLLQYDRNGRRTRSRQYGTAGSEDFTAVAVSSSGNVFATGSTGSDFAGPASGSADVVVFRISF